MKRLSILFISLVLSASAAFANMQEHKMIHAEASKIIADIKESVGAIQGNRRVFAQEKSRIVSIEKEIEEYKPSLSYKALDELLASLVDNVSLYLKDHVGVSLASSYPKAVRSLKNNYDKLRNLEQKVEAYKLESAR